MSDDRCVNSIHASFLRPGDIEKPLEFEVEHLRDGRSFSQRSVRVTQEGKEISRSLISFHISEPGLDYQAAAMPEVPGPESFSFSYSDFLEEANDLEPRSARNRVRPIELRYVNPPDNRPRASTAEPQLMWTRITEPLGDEPWRHQAGLAYISDVSLIDQIALPHGRRWDDPELTTTSLDHAMWFHLPASANEWLLFEQQPEGTGRGRGLARGRFFDTAGRLVALCVQEGLMRLQT